MRTLFTKFIIWLFEKYAYDYWVDLQAKKDNKRLLKKHKTDDIEEAYQCEIDEQKSPQKEAYDAGAEGGYNKGYLQSHKET